MGTMLPPHKRPRGEPRQQEFGTMTPRIERPIPRRGLSREEAAMYIGISASKFDELVRDGRMPGPKRVDGRKIWDVRDLDVAFDALPSENPQLQGSSWDDFRAL
jgi:excisionase family DNA binding protein